MCCKLLKIEPLEKPPHVWCRHFVVDQGCGIHGRHPKVCKAFRCSWLDDGVLGEEWRPDRCGFMLHCSVSGIGLWINVDLEHCGAWRNEPYYAQIKRWSETVRHGTGIVAVTEGERRFVIFPEQDLPVSAGAAGAAITAGYHRRPGWRQPFAKIKSTLGTVEEFVGVPIPELR
jgi:hypothetical protein